MAVLSLYASAYSYVYDSLTCMLKKMYVKYSVMFDIVTIEKEGEYSIKILIQGTKKEENEIKVPLNAD